MTSTAAECLDMGTKFLEHLCGVGDHLASFRVFQEFDVMASAPQQSSSDSMLAVQHWLGRHKVGDDSARRS